MALPNPNFVASVPLQYCFRDKDTGLPMSAGVVSFFSDPDFTIPKSVYEISNNPGNITFVDLGNVLILSSIGTFVDDSGENLVPYYWPWTNPAGSADPGAEQLYFVTVYNSSGTFQFSLTNWPPNSLSGEAPIPSSSSPTPNILTNPQFSVVSFTVDPADQTYTYTVSGNQRNPIAPGWELVTVGSGSVVVSQASIGLDIITEPPFGLNISSSGTLSSLQLVQRLYGSPRILAEPHSLGGGYASGYFIASSMSGTSATLSLTYSPSDAGTAVQLCTGTTDTSNDFLAIFGTALIPAPLNTDNGSGYVDIIINIAINTSVTITSVQVTGAEDADSIPTYIQQTTQENLNGMFWYYKPELAYKPIPYYTIGWDFPLNPGQELGSSGGPYTLGAPNRSQYIADQTILFQSIDASFSFTLAQNGTSPPAGLTLTTANASTFALIQYLDTPTTVELLNQRIAAMVSGYIKDSGAITSLVGNVNLYWTTNAAVPVLPLSCISGLVVSGTDIVTPTPTAGWTLIPRSGLGDAPFSFTTTSSTFNFQGWDATTVSGINTAKWFAIVVSFNALQTTTAVTLDYITLCGGDIATPPAPLNFAQNLQALQYYYEASAPFGVAASAGTVVNQISKPVMNYVQNTGANVNGQAIGPVGFDIHWDAIKRVIPKSTSGAPIIYSTTGATNAVNLIDLVNGAGANTDRLIATYWATPSITTKSITFNTTGTPFGSVVIPSGATFTSYITFQYIADSRLGVI